MMANFRYLVFCLLVTHNCVVQAQGPIDPEVRVEIDRFINEVYLPTAGITNLGVAIVADGGDSVYTTGFGWADEERGIPMGNETQLPIGSITKSVTATVVAKTLAEKFPELGASVLDTPIRKLLPTFDFTLIDRFRSEHVTFRDLLAHRVCIYTGDILQASEALGSAEMLVYRQRYAEEVCGVRSDFVYNNEMFIVAGHLVSLIAGGIPFQVLVNQLLADIGMTNSTFVEADDDLENMAYRAKPYYMMDGESHLMNTRMVNRLALYQAAGGLVVPPNDMTKYLEFHLNKGMVGGVQVVPEEVMRWLTTPANLVQRLQYKEQEDDKVAIGFGYGLGLELGAYDGWEVVTHSGYFPAYSSLMTLYPGLGIGVFTGTNQRPFLASPVDLHNFIFEVLKGSGVKTAAKFEKKLEADRARSLKEIEKRKEIRQRFVTTTSGGKQSEVVGQYGNGAGGELEIVERFNPETNSIGLYITHGKWLQAWLEEVEGSPEVNYVLNWDSDLVQDFYAGGDPTATLFAQVGNGTVQFFQPGLDGSLLALTKYVFGVNLGNLPPIPWDPESCGLE